jgi:hypothetical protein
MFGPRIQRPRPNLSISAVAILFAAQTFTSGEGSYPIYMAVLAWLSAGWITWFAIQKRALLGLLALPVSLFWLNPILGGVWFSTFGIEYLLTHAVLALLWSGCAYTFLATEKR